MLDDSASARREATANLGAFGQTEFLEPPDATREERHVRMS
jgi:hypothetical protein